MAAEACPRFGLTSAVDIDLRGHTLSGTGSNTAIDAYELDHFGVAVYGGGFPDTVTDVTFTRNTTGIRCWESCRISGSEFKDNETGFIIGADTGGTITDTTFTGNQRGGQIGCFPCSVKIERSTFSSNALGLDVAYSYVTVADTKFIKNTVGVKVTSDGEVGCVTFTRTTFTKNGTNVVGEPSCS